MQQKISKIRKGVLGEVQHEMTGIQTQMHIDKVASTGIIRVDDVPATSVMKLPTFDGKVPWLTYICQFEAAFAGNNCSSPEKARIVVLALGSDAMEILRNIPEEKQNDYEYIVTFLDMSYEKPLLQEVYNFSQDGRKINEEIS